MNHTLTPSSGEPKETPKDSNRPEEPPRRPGVVFYSFLVLFCIILVLNYIVFRHFLLVVIVATSAAAMLGPLYDRVTNALGGRRSLAAGLIVALTTVVIFVPLFSYAAMLGTQAVSLFEVIRPRLEPEALRSFLMEELPARYPLLENVKNWLQLGGSEQAPLDAISPALSRLASGANRLVQGAVAGLTSTLFDLILFLITLFFVLRDGPMLGAEIRGIAPVSTERANEVYDRLTRTVKGVLYSMVVVPVTQGLLAMLGFGIFRLPAPIFWGTMLILAAIIPGIGSPLVWVPAAVYLLLTAPPWQGLGLLVYGTLVISTSDNIIKPILLRETAQIHPLLAFFAILGGMLSFGVIGFLIGPVILSLMLSVIRIYRKDILAAPLEPTAEAPPDTAR